MEPEESSPAATDGATTATSEGNNSPTESPAPNTTDRPTATAIPTEPTTIATIANSPTPTAEPTLALPPEGLTGSQNLLELYDSAKNAPFWDESYFNLQGSSWRLGRSDQSDSETIFHYPPPELLERQYGNAAPRRISRVEAELALHSTNPALLNDEAAIYFGLLLQSIDGEDKAGIQIQQVSQNVISLALYQDDQANIISQRSVNNLIARLRLERDLSNGAISAYFNDSQIGEPIDFVPADAEIAPVIFVKAGGVVIGVSAWEITLE